MTYIRFAAAFSRSGEELLFYCPAVAAAGRFSLRL